MKVYLFKIDKEKVGGYSSGEAIVAAHDKSEAWTTLSAELPDYDLECFSADKCEEILSLKSVLDEPAVITYNCYYE